MSRSSFAATAAVILAAVAGCGGGKPGGDASSIQGADAACVDACGPAGQTRCSGQLVETCAAGADGCRTWSAAACPGGLACDAQQDGCPERLVNLSWAPNRERGVNQAGGGYRVAISGRQEIDVPFASGAAAPTSASVQLPPGSYAITVRAYAALDAQGGTSRTLSAPSAPISLTVP